MLLRQAGRQAALLLPLFNLVHILMQNPLITRHRVVILSFSANFPFFRNELIQVLPFLFLQRLELNINNIESLFLRFFLTVVAYIRNVLADFFDFFLGFNGNGFFAFLPPVSYPMQLAFLNAVAEVLDFINEVQIQLRLPLPVDKLIRVSVVVFVLLRLIFVMAGKNTKFILPIVETSVVFPTAAVIIDGSQLSAG